MRRIFILALSILQFLAAGVLCTIAWQLPDRAKVEEAFGRAEKVSRQAARQIHHVRDQVHVLKRPELPEIADRMQIQLQIVTRTLRSKQIDFATVASARDALESVAGGLDGLQDTLDPAIFDKLGDGLRTTADFLDKRLIPAALTGAEELEKATEGLQHDARALAKLLRSMPVDLKAVREVYQSLTRFDQGLEKIGGSLSVDRLKKMRDGFKGMDTALSTGAAQVERLADFTYPVFSFDGLRPNVDQRAFWPRGATIAKGLRQASEGVKAADEQLGELLHGLPELQTAIDESRKMVQSTREAMGKALEQQATIEPIFKQLPEMSSRLAESLPEFSAQLIKVLRETRRIKEVAVGLRQASDGLRLTRDRWPDLQRTIASTSKLMRATGQQLDEALHHQEEYRAALEQTIALGEAFATMLPLVSRQMYTQFNEQEQSLDELGNSMQDVAAVVPEYGNLAVEITSTGKLLIWLVAVIVALHGVYMLSGLRTAKVVPKAG